MVATRSFTHQTHSSLITNRRMKILDYREMRISRPIRTWMATVPDWCVVWTSVWEIRWTWSGGWAKTPKSWYGRGSGENKKSNHKNERESCRYLITVRKHSARQNHRLKFVSQAGSFQRTQVRLKTDSRQDARNRQRITTGLVWTWSLMIAVRKRSARQDHRLNLWRKLVVLREASWLSSGQSSSAKQTVHTSTECEKEA